MKGEIIVFEDIHEPLYKIDRCLTQIHQAGLFAKFAGLVFADFKNCGNLLGKKELFAKFADYVKGPVISGVPFGHVFPTLSFCVGEKVIFDV